MGYVLHRLRSVLVRPGRDRLAGLVEVDETFIGGEESGLRGGRARGKKVLTGIAVEVREPTEQAEDYGDKGLAIQLEDFVRDESSQVEETERILRDWPL